MCSGATYGYNHLQALCDQPVWPQHPLRNCHGALICKVSRPALGRGLLSRAGRAKKPWAISEHSLQPMCPANRDARCSEQNAYVPERAGMAELADALDSKAGAM